jgi:hypothetical protein
LTNLCNLREKVIGPDYRWLMHDGATAKRLPALPATDGGDAMGLSTHQSSAHKFQTSPSPPLLHVSGAFDRIAHKDEIRSGTFVRRSGFFDVIATAGQVRLLRQVTRKRGKALNFVEHYKPVE